MIFTTRLLGINGRNSKANSSKRLGHQARLMIKTLKLIWEGNRSPEYKFPTLFKLKTEMSCEFKIDAESFSITLAYLIQQKEVILKDDSRGEFRVWNPEGFYFRKKTLEFYELLELEWDEVSVLNLNLVLKIFNVSEGLQDKFLRKMLILLSSMMLIDVFRGIDGNLKVMKPLFSKKIKEDILMD